MKKKEFIDEIQNYLILSSNDRQNALNEVYRIITSYENQGCTWDEILMILGNPKEIALNFNSGHNNIGNNGYFEYKSNKNSQFPIIHIVLPNRSKNNIFTSRKIPVARGVFAFGRISQGIFSVGILSQGVVSFGLVSIGAICGGFFSIGIISISLIALGFISIGNLAIGYLGMGNIVMGQSGFGNIVVGKYALGNVSFGEYAINMGNNPSLGEIRNFLKQINTEIDSDILSKSFFGFIQNLFVTPRIIISFSVLMIVAFLVLTLIYRFYIKKVNSKKGVFK